MIQASISGTSPVGKDTIESMRDRVTALLFSSMSKRAVDQLERLVPPLRKWHRFAYEEHFFRAAKWERLFHGVYPTFEAAERAIPAGAQVGFDNDDAAHFLGHKGSIFPSDYPVLFWLEKLLPENKRVFDFGGYLGISFYTYKKVMTYPADLHWTVFDVPAVVTAGRQLALEQRESQLTFTGDLSEASRADILLAAGSIHFCREEFSDELQSLTARPKHILINKLPLVEAEPFVTLHNMGPAFCPYKIMNRTAVVQSILDCGYELINSWSNPDLSCYIPFHPERTVRAYTGMYFRRKA
jgi:putative methyltransferase (TIGR04325 family)